jgi:glucokinase
MPVRFDADPRVVMTLDAGGSSFRFSAIQGNRRIVPLVVTASDGDRLDKCLANIIYGFAAVREKLSEPPVAISFAFPGPADYPAGIIGELPNLHAFRGGVALGPMLEDHFGIRVFINNDGDLFTYGEAIAGILPWLNGLLEQSGSTKRYRNLFGITLGTGLGGGLVIDNKLVIGDNSIAGEAWLLRNKLDPSINAEEGACIRSSQRTYAELAGVPFSEVPEPKELFAIATTGAAGNAAAAREAFRRLGIVAGDAIAQALTLIDGLAVVGGGISAAHSLFLEDLVEAVNGCYETNGRRRRLIARAFNLEDPSGRAAFLLQSTKDVKVPGSGRIVRYDAEPRTGIGVSRLGTSEAIAVGAYALALERLSLEQRC